MVLNSNPLSVNSMYYGNKQHGMTAEAKEWQQNVFYQLSHYSAELAELRKAFDPAKHAYVVRLTFVIPSPIYYTKAGAMSSHAGDISNFEKSIIDCLFLPKHFGTNVPRQCENLNVDDKYLKSMTSRKVAGLTHQIRISVRVVNN